MKFLERFWWLRLGAIRFHLSLFLRVRLALVPILIRFTRGNIASDEAYRLFASKLLGFAAEMEGRSDQFSAAVPTHYASSGICVRKSWNRSEGAYSLVY